MFFSRIKKSLKTFTFISFVGAVFFGSFCTGMFHGDALHAVEMSEDYSLIQKSDTCCGSTYFEKIVLWQSISISNFNDLRTNLVLFGILISTVLVRTYYDHHSSQRLLARIRWLLRGKHILQIFTPLQLAFADGILNPKTY